MPDVKRQALLPKGEANGLAVIADRLADEGTGRVPAKMRAALVIFDAQRVTIESDTHDELTTVRVRRVEVVLPGDLPEAEKLIRRALESRTGEPVLPLDLEDELEATFREMAAPDSPDDPDVGPADPDAKGKGKGK